MWKDKTFTIIYPQPCAISHPLTTHSPRKPHHEIHIISLLAFWYTIIGHITLSATIWNLSYALDIILSASPLFSPTAVSAAVQYSVVRINHGCLARLLVTGIWAVGPCGHCYTKHFWRFSLLCICVSFAWKQTWGVESLGQLKNVL